MSAFSGKVPGGMRAHRARKRAQAEDRNAATPLERTAKFRHDRTVVQAAVTEARARREQRDIPAPLPRGRDVDTALAACACGHSRQMHQLAETGFCLSAGCLCARFRVIADEAVAS